MGVKKLGKTIALSCVAGFLAIVLVAGNIVLSIFAPLLHVFFGGARNDFGGAQGVLDAADSVVRDVAEESMVLLKNDVVDGTAFLPRPKTEKFNLFGWASTDQGFLIVGGGSGGVNITSENLKQITLAEAFKESGVSYNEDLIARYSEYSSFDADYRRGGSTGANAVQSLRNPPSSFYTPELMNSAHDYSSTAIVTLARWGAENGGYDELVSIKGDNGGTNNFSDGSYLELTPEEKAIFDNLREYKFKVIVLLNTTNPIEMSFLDVYDDIIEACMYVGIPGQSGAAAIPNLLVGEKTVYTYETDFEGGIVYDENNKPIVKDSEVVQISPSGRLSDTYALDWQSHNPSYINATPTSGSSGNSIGYAEGIYFGYKWYETADAAGYFEKQGTSYEQVVKYPFGYGLSYTTFEQEIIDRSWNDGDPLNIDDTYTVTVRVTNTGNRPGRDVVQLYYTAPYIEGGIEKASINLLAFGKTAELKPQSESETDSVQELTLSFTPYELASYDDYDKNSNGFTGYELDPGNYYIKLMKNAHEVIETASLFCGNGLKFEKDPVTGESVENRFTGNTAYANMPIDGSKGVNGGMVYLSRANGFANFSELKKVGTPTSAATNSSVTEYNPDIQTEGEINYGQDMGIYLIVQEDGQKAPLALLNGDSSSEKLMISEDKFEMLKDWDSELWGIMLDQLTQENIKDLIGKGGFQTVAIEEIGKRRNEDLDGPAGFNRNVADSDNPNPVQWTVFPAETLSGCSWSASLMYKIGYTQGDLGAATGEQGWYAPGVNLHRSVYNSRNYEYYSEDGVLSGRLAAQTVKGAKENNLYCYVKHFVISDNGQNAQNWYEWLTEQSLRECYLKAFEITVKEGGANAMMSAFNKLGAVWCGYNRALLTDVLRTEWGFRGSVITDWYQTGSYMSNYSLGVKAGNDLWLNTANSTANINFNDPQNAYAARMSVKGILYTYIDTYMTATGHRGVGTINAAAHSPLFVALWVILDVLLVAGIGVCVLFIFLPKRVKPAAGDDGAGDAGAASTDAQ